MMRPCFLLTESERPCGNTAIESFGSIPVCGKHRDRLESALLGAIWHGSLDFRLQVREYLDEFEETRRQERVARIASARAENSVVYFVEREDLVKIGWTTNLTKRVREIGNGSSMPHGMTIGPVQLLATTPGDRQTEAALHKLFAHLRFDSNREWFLFVDEIRDFIAGLSCNRSDAA